ncbi:MAG: N-acetylglucosamine-6-phosphate deacetylase [Candidatus Melainabacteria bacterium GWA2_34_9]|nr:MAG: N-acetylglucosamine-6-phosphate deacetylase [Candidatus Melainabacteria bacterium GWA2_34_9]
MKKLTIIKNGYVQNPDCPKIKANIVIHGNKIIDTSASCEFEFAKNFDVIEYIDAKELTISPGLIDQHIHGGYGIDFNTAKADDLVYLTKELAKHGITSLVATVMTDSEENIKQQIKEISEAMKNQLAGSARIIGIHLEGPFLNPDFKGIHPDNHILEPNIKNFKKFENENIKIVSYAPELDKNLEFTKYLVQKNIIPSAGHSKATHEELKTAINEGLKQVTHLFNAMPQLHHRNPGIVGETLTNDKIYAEIIADNEHLHPIILDLILRTKPKSKIIFISDSLPLNYSTEDHIIFGGQKIYRINDQAVNENGTFAGSLSFLDENLRKNIEKINFSDFLMYSSLNPAKNLGLKTKGFIDKDFDADLVLWDENFQVKQTIIGGLIAY